MDLPIVYHPDYVAPLPEGHRFPMPKFSKLYQMLLADGVAIQEQIYIPEHPPQEWIELVHTPEYIQAYCQGTLDAKAQRRIGLPWSPALANRTCIAVGGAILTAKLALTHGLACNTAGGTHHAFPTYGSGFCIFNDLAISARVLQHLGLIRKILILDLDVHQGDGTAYIFQNDNSVFTFSMHCEVNFPGTKQQSDLDVPQGEVRQGEADDRAKEGREDAANAVNVRGDRVLKEEASEGRPKHASANVHEEPMPTASRDNEAREPANKGAEEDPEHKG